MIDYFAFADRILLYDEEEEIQEAIDLTQEQEDLEVQTDPQPSTNESLVINPTLKEAPETYKKCSRDKESDEEELIDGSGLFVKFLRILRCLDIKKWIMSHMNPPSILNTQVWDQCTESLHFPMDIQRWMKVDKDELPNALEVTS